MSAVVSNVPPASVLEEDLRAKSLVVEDLRRRIAAESANGVAAPPALLTEFARAHRVYLNHKIETERRKRIGEVPAPELPSAAAFASETAPTVVVKPSSADASEPEIAYEFPTPFIPETKVEVAVNVPVMPVLPVLPAREEVRSEVQEVPTSADETRAGRKESVWIWLILGVVTAALLAWIVGNGWK